MGMTVIESAITFLACKNKFSRYQTARAAQRTAIATTKLPVRPTEHCRQKLSPDCQTSPAIWNHTVLTATGHTGKHVRP